MPHHLNLRVIIAQGLIFAFLFNSFGPLPLAQAQDFALPAPGVRVGLSPAFNPPILKGIKVHPDNPFRFDFILDKGDEGAQAHKSTGAQEEIKSQATKLIKYFLASLTIPEKDLWVNLSPYEKNRIVPESFGQTEMGRDLLAEDYMLKQITASLIYPQGETGKRFWKRIYEESAKKFGTTNIPVNTFNKVWIVPDKAVVYENAKAGTAYVVESKLKVMLEEDYLALSKNSSPLESPPPNLPHQGGGISALGSQIIREIVIPELIKEVNQGKNFSQLRQVYNSLILATWYKKKIKDSILEQVYADKNKIKGVEYNNSLFNGGQPGDTFRERCPQAGCQANQGLNVKATQRNVPNDVEIIYQRYLQAFKKGAYNYIKEEIDPISQQTIPRKYFSGGIAVFGYLENVEEFTSHIPEGVMSNDQAMVVETQLNQAIINQKTVAAMEGRVSKPADAAMNDEKEESQSKEDKIVFNSSVPLLINQIQNFTETQKIFSGRFFKKDLEDVNSLFKMLRNFLKYGSYSIDLVAELLTNALLYSGNGNNVTVNAGLNINPAGNTIFKMSIHQDFISDNDWHILVRNSRLKTWAEKNRENRLNNGLAQREGKGLYRFFVLSQMGQPMILEYVRKGEALDTILWVKIDTAMTGAAVDDAMRATDSTIQLLSVMQSERFQHALGDVVQYLIYDNYESQFMVDIKGNQSLVERGTSVLTGPLNTGNVRVDPNMRVEQSLAVLGTPLFDIHSHPTLLESHGVRVMPLPSEGDLRSWDKKGNHFAGIIWGAPQLGFFFSVLDVKRLKKNYNIKADYPSEMGRLYSEGILRVYRLSSDESILDSGGFESNRYRFTSKELNIQSVLYEYHRILKSEDIIRQRERKRIALWTEKGFRLAGEQDPQDLRGALQAPILEALLNDFNRGINWGARHSSWHAGEILRAEMIRESAFLRGEVRFARKNYGRSMGAAIEKAEVVLRMTDEAVKRDFIMSDAEISKAMTARGGIDLTSDKALRVQNNSQGIKFHIDPAMLQQLQNAPGFVPVIINIQPMNDLHAWLGVGSS